MSDAANWGPSEEGEKASDANSGEEWKLSTLLMHIKNKSLANIQFNPAENGASDCHAAINGKGDANGQDDNAWAAVDANDGNPTGWAASDGSEKNGWTAADDDVPAGDDNTCRNCGQSGHFARECPEPRKMTGACFNCGQEGHNKADCSEPKKPTGECFNCGEPGHMKADCPKPRVVKCRICEQEGHLGSDCPDRVCAICKETGHSVRDCTAIRWDVFPSDIPVLTIDDAWDKLAKLGLDDMDDFMPTMLAYAKVSLQAGFALELSDVEDGLRNYESPFYLVAVTHEHTPYETVVGMDGRGGKEYVLRLTRSPKPTRAFEEAKYPSSEEENLERLRNCGFPMPNKLTICDNCHKEGHIRKNCPEEAFNESNTIRNKCIHCKEEGHRSRDCPTVAPAERVYHGACHICRRRGHTGANCPRRESRGRGDLTCNKCGETGHFARDCTSEVRKDITCRKCGQEGHMARDCPSGENEPLECLKCFNCHEIGHMSKDCPNERVSKCKNCDEVGHMARECPKPRDYSRVKCRNCGEFGHTVARCTKEKPEAVDNSNWGNENTDMDWGNDIGNTKDKFSGTEGKTSTGTFGNNNAGDSGWEISTVDW